MNLLQRPNPLWTVVAILGGMALAALAASHLAHNGSLQVESDSVRRQLDLYTQSLQQRIDRYNTLPQLRWTPNCAMRFPAPCSPTT